MDSIDAEEIFSSMTSKLTLTGGKYNPDPTNYAADGSHIHKTGNADFPYAVERGDDWAFKGWTWSAVSDDDYTAVANYGYACGAEGSTHIDAAVTSESKDGVTTYTAMVTQDDSPDRVAHTGNKIVTAPVVADDSITTTTTDIIRNETNEVVQETHTATTATGGDGSVARTTIVDVESTASAATVTATKGDQKIAAVENAATSEAVKNIIAIDKIVTVDAAALANENKNDSTDVSVKVKVTLEAKLTNYSARDTDVNSVETITYDVKPVMTTTVTVGGVKDETKSYADVVVPNTDLTGAAITVKLPIPAAFAAVGQRISIKHIGDGKVEYLTGTVKSAGEQRYVEFTTTYFSSFELISPAMVQLTFDANGGVGGTTLTLTSGGAVTAPTVARSGYTFKGWDKSVPSTADASAVYTAQWTRNSTGSSRGGGAAAPVNTDTGINIEKEEVPLSELPLMFTDVAANDWYREAVAYVFSHDLMVGVSDTQFAPGADSTRGMVALILMRLANGEAVEDALSFTDVTDGDWYAEAAAWAARNGVYEGYEDGSFRGGNAITREQLAAVLYRYAQLKELDVSKTAELTEFSDAASVSGYAAEAVRWAVGAGLFVGNDGKLNPTSHATRAELAAVLMRFCEALPKTESTSETTVA